MLHLFSYDCSIREESPDAYDACGRWLLEGATMLGWCGLWGLGHPSPLMEDIMIGLLAGAIIDQIFTVELTITNETRFVWLILEVVTCLGIFLPSTMFTGRARCSRGGGRGMIDEFASAPIAPCRTRERFRSSPRNGDGRHPASTSR